MKNVLNGLKTILFIIVAILCTLKINAQEFFTDEELSIMQNKIYQTHLLIIELFKKDSIRVEKINLLNSIIDEQDKLIKNDSLIISHQDSIITSYKKSIRSSFLPDFINNIVLYTIIVVLSIIIIIK